MESLKQHWKTILITSVITTLSVVTIFSVSKLYSEGYRVVPLAQTQAQTDLKIKGNKSSRIYHLPDCPNYDDISERNIIWFKTHEEAKAKGFRMAQNC